jgi:hypothetical protein
MDIMLKNVNKEDIYYLTSKPDIKNRHFGWYAMDDEKNITWKYIHFIYNMKDEFLNYDWYVLIDDDTFVFHERLQTYLSTFNSKENYYIGKELDHIKKDFCIYMSGGAGGGITIVVNPSAGMDERELADLVSRKLAQQMRRGAA